MSDEEKPERIRDIPSYRRLAEDAEGIETLSELWPLAKAFGLIEEDLPLGQEAIEGLRRKTEEILGLPDRFNALFASKGWIAYESLNHTLMTTVVQYAEAEEFEKAERELLSYYKAEENVRWHLRTMMAVRAWRPREGLASLAMEDYLAGRYHACIPIVLALMDGLVSDLATTGFFAEGTELTAWDSVAGHSSGLKVLCGIFNKGRRRTTEDIISLPYRHGILHGRDLGYANGIVAAKVWGALFAVREWAQKAEAGPSSNENTPTPTLLESISAWAQLQEEKRELESWKPRSRSGDFWGEGTPEHLALDVFKSWSAKNYGGLATCISALSGAESTAKRAGRIRQNIEPKQITSFQVISMVDEAPATSVVFAKVFGQASFAREIEEYLFGLRMVYEDPQGTATLRGKAGGSWKVMEWSLYTPRKASDLTNSTLSD